MSRILLFVFAAVMLSACTDALTIDQPKLLTLDIETAALDLGDSTRVIATVIANSGEHLTTMAVRWRSSDPAVATVSDGLITARKVGSAMVTAEAAGFSDKVQVSVVPPRAEITCMDRGTEHRVTAGGRWRRADSPHFIRDSVYVDSPLILEPGTVICGYPGSSLRISGNNRVVGTGTPTRPVRFTAVDTVLGWRGISTDPHVLGGSITLKHVDARFSGSFSGISVAVDSSVLYRTSVAAIGNFAGGSITNLRRG
jgi:hypothetical protein